MADPKWSILIATLAWRSASLLRLLDVLLPQAEAAPGQVEVVALRNSGEELIGTYRQRLLDDARGEYVSFIDDDDLVEPDMVPAVLAAMRAGPDYISFRYALYWDGQRDPKPVLTGLSYDGWGATAEAYFVDVNHTNPVRATLARQAGFPSQGPGEDQAYDRALRPLLKTEAVIGRTLYHYYRSTTESVQVGLRPAASYPPSQRPEVASPVFRWHPWSTDGTQISGA